VALLPPNKSTHTTQVVDDLETLWVSAGGRTLPSPGEAAAAALDASDALRECVACMLAPRGARLRPCCCVSLCAACAAELVKARQPRCPNCRSAVARVDAGYFEDSSDGTAAAAAGAAAPAP
jgi:hypothetical protein